MPAPGPDASEHLLRQELADGDDPVRRLALARLLYNEDRIDECRVELEAAYRSLRGAGQAGPAARVAMLLADVQSGMFGNLAVAQGWLGRARRLLEGVGPCVEWGWYELAITACDRTDVDDLARSAERALALAAEYGDGDLEVRALADGGLALVSQGRVQEGMARLDEALAAISAGEVADDLVAGTAFCAMLTSCDRTGDVRRAEEWLRVVDERVLGPTGGRPRVLHTHCRLAYGAVLSYAGRWVEAEAAMLEALGPSGSRSLGHRVETVARLAELRVHQGRVDEAVELLAPYEDATATCQPLALTHLARGEPELAVAAAERGLRTIVGDQSRLAPLLAVLVEAHLARADLDEAEAAAVRLVALAGHSELAALAAEGALATGRCRAARGDSPGAVESFQAALAHLDSGTRPLLAGMIRLELAEARAGDDPAAAIVEARAALAVFERLGSAGLADRTAALLRRLGAPGRVRTAAAGERLAGLTARESEVLALVRQGLTNGEIAARLYITPKTAEHHVGRILTKLGVRTRAEAAALAAAATLHTP
jgi:DNA-binding CsgD family transcriptional regulator